MRAPSLPHRPPCQLSRHTIRYQLTTPPLPLSSGQYTLPGRTKRRQFNAAVEINDRLVSVYLSELNISTGVGCILTRNKKQHFFMRTQFNCPPLFVVMRHNWFTAIFQIFFSQRHKNPNCLNSAIDSIDVQRPHRSLQLESDYGSQFICDEDEW